MFWAASFDERIFPIVITVQCNKSLDFIHFDVMNVSLSQDLRICKGLGNVTLCVAIVTSEKQSQAASEF